MVTPVIEVKRRALVEELGHLRGQRRAVDIGDQLEDGLQVEEAAFTSLLLEPSLARVGQDTASPLAAVLRAPTPRRFRRLGRERNEHLASLVEVEGAEVRCLL